MASDLLQQLRASGCAFCSRYLFACILLGSVAAPFLHAQPSAGLVAHWPLNGNAADASGNGLEGRISGPTPTMDRFGRADSAYSFDGVNDYIEVPNSSGLNLDINTGITFSCWVKGCSSLGMGVILERLTNPSAQNADSGWSVGIVPTGGGTSSPGFLWHTTDQQRANPGRYLHDRVNLKPSLDDNEWHHLAFVLRPSSIAFYVDGSYEMSMFVDSINYCCYNTSSPLRIGAGAWDNWPVPPEMMQFFDGALDDIRIYDRDLTDMEVRALYREAGWTPQERKINLLIEPLAPTQICKGGEVQLKITHDGNRVGWNTLQGVVNPGYEVVTIRPQTTTTYRIRAYRPISGYPCPDTLSMTDSITITVLDPPKAKAGDNPHISVCVGNTIALGGETEGGTAPYNWRWLPSDGLDNPTAERPRFFATEPGNRTYRVMVTDAKGCLDSAEVSVLVLPASVVDLGPDTLYYCPGKGVLIGGTADPGTVPIRYSWTPRIGLNRTDSGIVFAAPEIATKYVLAVENVTGCITSDSIVVVPSPRPINIGPDTLVCPGTALMIGTPAEPGVIYQWSPTTGILDPTASRILITPTTNTVYRLTATDPRTGCTAVDSMLVRMYDPQLTVDETTIDFGILNGCTSELTLPVDITNRGTMPTRIEGWSSESAAFALLDTSLLVPAGRTVTVRIRYIPPADGTHEGPMTLRFGSCDQTLVLTLQGKKQTAEVAVIPPAVHFDNLLSCGLRQTDTSITLLNSGISTVVIKGALAPAPFVVTTSSFPITLAPGQSGLIRFQYFPTGPGRVAGAMDLSYESDGCTNVLHVPVSAFVEEPDLETLTEKIDFGVLEGCSFERDSTVLLHNPSITDITITQADVPDGYVLLNPLPIVVPAGEDLELGLRFSPSSSDRFAGSLHLRTAPCDGTISIQVDGERRGTWFTLPDTLDFGEIALCADLEKTVPLKMLFSGEGDGSVRLLSVTGPFTTTLAEGTVLPGGIEQTFAVRFSPTEEGEYIGELVLVLEPCALERRIVIRGKATQLELNGNDYALTITSNTSPVVAEVLFRNTGSAVARIDRVQGLLPPFTLVGTTPTLPANLQPNEELRVTVRYAPFPEKAQSPVQIIMTSPCSQVTEAMIYAGGIPGPGSKDTSLNSPR